MIQTRTVLGAILDIDGTLIDSNDAHAFAWNEALDSIGVRTSFDETRICIGMGSDKLMVKLAGFEENSIRGQDLAKRKSEIFRKKYLPHLKAFPKSKELLTCFHDEGIRLATASSSQPEEQEELIQILNLNFQMAVLVPDTAGLSSKPDPDVVSRAIQALNLTPAEVLMIGDTPYDVSAASRAGIGIVGLLCGGWSASHLHGALAIYKDPEDLYKHFYNSPFAAPLYQHKAA